MGWSASTEISLPFSERECQTSRDMKNDKHVICIKRTENMFNWMHNLSNTKRITRWVKCATTVHCMGTETKSIQFLSAKRAWNKTVTRGVFLRVMTKSGDRNFQPNPGISGAGSFRQLEVRVAVVFWAQFRSLTCLAPSSIRTFFSRTSSWCLCFVCSFLWSQAAIQFRSFSPFLTQEYKMRCIQQN